MLDEDLANNSNGWQWICGSGVDAAPYFRIFNPTLQGEKFDLLGEYVRKWVPELTKFPNEFIHKPWEMSKKKLEQLGITFGYTYPIPMVEHTTARFWALKAYKTCMLFADDQH